MAVDADTIRRAEERVGSVLNGKYRLDHVVGIGGMAVVYAATHRNQKQFAVKMLHPELSIRADVRTRFLREGYAANSVKHAGAVAVMDDDLAADGAAFLVMELLEGACVETIWQKHDRKLPLASVLAIGHQLLDVLAAAHAKGIIHRDIKPANLFVTEEGQLKVLDFGIARVRDMVGSGVEGTGTGMVLGTPAFMAPEQALAKANEINAQTDIWAVGATLFALLAGRHVHGGENAAELLVRTATTPARLLHTVSADIPASVVAVVDRALAFHNSDRWPTAVAMRDAVRDAHLTVFGRRVSRDSLLPLASSERAAPDPTAETEPSSKSTLASPGISRSTAAGVSGAPTVLPVSDVPTTKPSPVGTTSQAMSSAHERTGRSGVRSRRAMVTGVVSIATAAFLAAGAALLMQTRSIPPSAAVAGTSTWPMAQSPSAGAAPSSPLVPLSAPPVSSPVATAAIDALRSPHTVVAAPELPASAPPATNVLVRPPTSGPARGAPLPIAPSSATALKPSQAKPSARNCNPNYVLDADGNKIFKPECFGLTPDTGGSR